MIAAALASATACDQLFGIEERPLASQTDAGDATTGADAPTGDDSSSDAPGTDGDATTAGDTASGDGTPDAPGDGTAEAPSDGEADAPEVDAPSCTGPTIYVATTGKDSNPGCDPSNPKATLANAIAAAASPDAGVTTIEVCAGTYAADSLTLDAKVSLAGGYDCTHGTPWKRTATYGYPSFDGVNLTTLQVATTSASGATLTITGPTATGPVDGFTIQGQLLGSIGFTAAAIRVTGGSSPTISNDHLVGGGTTYTATAPDPTPASAAVVVDNGASPLLTTDTLEGGSGTTTVGTGTGSVGAYTTGANGPLTITGCTIHGGSGHTTGPSGSGSQGVLLTGSTGVAYTIQSSTIKGGTGSNAACGNGCRATRGLYLSTGTAALVLTNDAIEGGDVAGNPNGSTTGTDCSHGVEAVAGGTVTVTDSRIYGGQCNLSGAASSASLYGLFVGGGATLVATNDMIHMGTSTIPHGGAALGTSSTAGPRIVHNTLIGGTSTGSTVAPLWIENATTGAVVENNILAGSGSAPQSAGLLLSCPADSGPFILASFHDNLVFGTTSALLQWSNCDGNASYATVDALQAELNSLQAGTAAGNVTVSSSCGTDSGCVAIAGCTSQASCLPILFNGFDVSTLGYTNLFPAQLSTGTCPTATSAASGNGWPLAAMPPCSVARSALNDSASVSKDLYGNCRSTAAPSMGAAEFTGTCH